MVKLSEPLHLLHTQVVTDPKHADFILAHGTEALGRGDGAEPEPIELDQIQALLKQCADAGGKPMLVANPDIITVSGRSLLPMPGKLGQWYKGMGGEVRLIADSKKPCQIWLQICLRDIEGDSALQVLSCRQQSILHLHLLPSS